MAGNITLMALSCGATLVSSASPRSARNSTAIIGSAICTAVAKNSSNAVTSTSGAPSSSGVPPSGRHLKVLQQPADHDQVAAVAKSSMVASIWWNLPKTVFLFIDSGS